MLTDSPPLGGFINLEFSEVELFLAGSKPR